MSKGDDVVHTSTHSRDSGDEPDATMTFTEEVDIDEMNVIDDLEDKERLIMNCGVSIPVSSHFYAFLSVPKMAFHIPCYLPSPLNMLAVDVSSLVLMRHCS